MALKVGNFGGISNLDIPQFQNRIPDLPRAAPRKINLSEEDESRISIIRFNFSRIHLDANSLFDIFEDWQSEKLKTVKKFFLFLSSLLFLSLLTGVNVADVDLFGITIQDNMSSAFLWTLLIILISSFFCYQYLRHHDLSIHRARITSVESALSPCIKQAAIIDNIVNKYRIDSAVFLFEDFRGEYDTLNPEMDTYEAIKFYQEYLEKPKQGNNVISILELTTMYVLFFTGLTAIVMSF